MPKRCVLGLVLAVAVAAPAPATEAPESPSLRQVLDRLAQYVSDYAVQMSLVIGTEHYTQETSGRSPTPVERFGPTVSGVKLTRTLTSEFALVRVNDDWMGFRDVYEVDGAPVRDRSDRMRDLFLDSRGTALAQLSRIADESARFNIGSIQRNFNTPTTALFFFQRDNQERFRFKKAGEDTIGSVLVWKVDYEERRKPTIIRTTQGKNVPARGTVWVDPTTGRVFRTSMNLHAEIYAAPPGPVGPPGASGQENPPSTQSKGAMKTEVNVTVTYAAEQRLGLLVPVEMDELYQLLEGQRTMAHATYSDFRRFETSTKVIIR